MRWIEEFIARSLDAELLSESQDCTHWKQKYIQCRTMGSRITHV